MKNRSKIKIIGKLYQMLPVATTTKENKKVYINSKVLVTTGNSEFEGKLIWDSGAISIKITKTDDINKMYDVGSVPPLYEFDTIELI